MANTIKFTAHIHWKKPYDGEDFAPGNFHVFYSDMTEYGYVPVSNVELELPLPTDFDPRAGQLRVLDEQERKVRAEFTRRITELQRQKQELLAIENTVEA